MDEPKEEVVESDLPEIAAATEQLKLYHLSFRKKLQPKAASSKILDLVAGELVMVHTDHGLEPAYVCGSGIELTPINPGKKADLLPILRRANNDEVSRYHNLIQRETEAKTYCQRRIQDLGLEMKLLQVERFFNGSKVIFYFSAETRVDFRDLVKSLVQEFRTRVEMRQIGVRHETQMLGGIGCCGRELCCGLFMKDFSPVSIKMAKEQDLPLNPAKISGVCNRLLCCLTHEYETYKALKKGMPKVGRVITFEERPFKVTQCKTLDGKVTVTSVDTPGDTRVLTRDEWEKGISAVKEKLPSEDRQEAKKPTAPPVDAKTPASIAAPAGKLSSSGKHHPRAKQPALGKSPQSQKPLAGRTPGEKPQGGKPEPARTEGAKPSGGKPHRSRRSRGSKKGKTP
ncbi:MAG: regulatory iron-sulfur-containing complex subunit RicT [Desulfobulbaceae bacterium]|nr:regulatory iron-sulfur-containing complex subunit RicT [Desulfobulbaceae bacterium]